MKKSLLIFVAATLFVACKKDEGNNTSLPLSTAANHLTSGKWFSSNYKRYDKVTDEHGTIVFYSDGDYDSALDSCGKDNWTKYNTDGTIISDQGIIKCDPDSFTNTDNQRWRLTHDDTRLEIYNLKDISIVTSIKIKHLDSQSMVLILEDTSYTLEGYNYVAKAEATYKHQIAK